MVSDQRDFRQHLSSFGRIVQQCFCGACASALWGCGEQYEDDWQARDIRKVFNFCWAQRATSRVVIFPSRFHTMKLTELCSTQRTCVTWSVIPHALLLSSSPSIVTQRELTLWVVLFSYSEIDRALLGTETCCHGSCVIPRALWLWNWPSIVRQRKLLLRLVSFLTRSCCQIDQAVLGTGTWCHGCWVISCALLLSHSPSIVRHGSLLWRAAIYPSRFLTVRLTEHP